MSIRSKLVLIVLPIIVFTLVLSGALSFFVASTGITRLARDFLDFKISQMENYTESQWGLLLQYELTDQLEIVEASKRGIESFARSIVRSDTELIFAIDDSGEVSFSSNSDVELGAADLERLRSLYDDGQVTFGTIVLDGTERVYAGIFFEPYRWLMLTTEHREVFYGDANRITVVTVGSLVTGVLLSVILLVVFARLLTNPLNRVGSTMRQIIQKSDLTARVVVQYDDETGQLAHTFNVMIGELERANNQIKRYAYSAVVAQKKELKIRHIFQKYVPREIIDELFKNPESMLVGDNRELAVLFSDIRSFSTISENLPPDDLVNALNRYFSIMVDVITGRNGVIDKYIGDAIMAFFGAPVQHKDDIYRSALAAIEMGEALEGFNKKQLQQGNPEFKTGIGINYGLVTVGNIGTEKKMDYTVIGDMVNLASRLEGLTKVYRQQIIVSESMHDAIKDEFPLRLLDLVAVKGKSQGVRIYTIQRQLDSKQQDVWGMHNKNMELYYSGDFAAAEVGFRKILQISSDDYIAAMFVDRCQHYQKKPPSADWDFIERLTEK